MGAIMNIISWKTAKMIPTIESFTPFFAAYKYKNCTYCFRIQKMCRCNQIDFIHIIYTMVLKKYDDENKCTKWIRCYSNNPLAILQWLAMNMAKKNPKSYFNAITAW